MPAGAESASRIRVEWNFLENGAVSKPACANGMLRHEKLKGGDSGWLPWDSPAVAGFFL